jgi:serine protease Do
MNHHQSTIRIVAISVLSTTLVVFIFAAIIWANRVSIARSIVSDSASEDVETPSGVMIGQDVLVVSAVKKANPAVVSISISKNVPVLEQYSHDPFGGLFGDLFSVPGVRQRGTELQEVGGGSGFFVSADGLIVTNRHVVTDEEAEYTVFTNDGKKHPARVIARDPFLDIAFLKVSGGGYPFLKFSDAPPALGQTAIAIGNALAEFRNTVSVGVISGLSRSIVAGDRAGQSETLDEVIQTDAAINPGNSGGPLIDLNGNVIGVNVAVALGSQNIGFALPSKGLNNLVESVKTTGKIVHPYLGVRYVEVTPALKERNNLSVDYGVLVQKGQSGNEVAVIPGSPAAKAGIIENDIILEVDGVKLNEDHKLSLVIRGKKVGDTVTLRVLRGGQERNVSVRLEAYNE